MKLLGAFIVALCLSVLPGMNAGALANSTDHPLAILQTEAPVPFSCEQEQCVATLATFSLDQHSYAPLSGQAYVLADGQAPSIGIGSRGKWLPLDEFIDWTFSANRAYTSVQLTLPKEAFEMAGFAKGTLEVMVDHPVALSLEQDLKEAWNSDFDFDAAFSVLDAQSISQSAEYIAGQLIIRTVTGLPAGTEAPTWDDAAERWAVIRDEALAAGAVVPERAISLVEGALNRCSDDIGGLLPVETCLWSHHDRLVSTLNRAYWRAVPEA